MGELIGTVCEGHGREFIDLSETKIGSTAQSEADTVIAPALPLVRAGLRGMNVRKRVARAVSRGTRTSAPRARSCASPSPTFGTRRIDVRSTPSSRDAGE